jgi:hypothetical protein
MTCEVAVMNKRGIAPRDERESEGAYLARHSLLLPGERKRLKKILNRSR